MTTTNEVSWIAVQDKLPECNHISCSSLVFLALEKRYPEIKPTITMGWYDFEAKHWASHFGSVEKVTHWQERNYP